MYTNCLNRLLRIAHPYIVNWRQDTWHVDCNTGSVQLHVGQFVSGKPPQHPFDLVQASWAPCGGLGGWFHSRARDVAAPIAGLIGIGYVALVRLILENWRYVKGVIWTPLRSCTIYSSKSWDGIVLPYISVSGKATMINCLSDVRKITVVEQLTSWYYS